jgi:Mg2+ and Co2+ transporter CorA
MKMTQNYNSIEKSLNVETKIISTEVESIEEEVVKDPQKDYEYSRNQLYNLINKGQEAIDGILEVAQESGHPRAYEVAVNAMKQVGDLTDKLLDLQKKMKDLDETVKGPTTVNNSLFVGSTAELSKLIKQGLLNNIEQ